MTQQDIESIVSGIRQLSGVVVVTVPDCLLYSAWQNPKATWDAEVVGAYFGQLLTSGTDGLRSIEGWEALDQLTLELPAGLLILRRTQDKGFVVGYVFERGTAVGWTRLNVARTFRLIENNLQAHLDDTSGRIDEDVVEITITPDDPPEPEPAPPPPPPAAPKPPPRAATKPPPRAATKPPPPRAATQPPAPAAAPAAASGLSKGARLMQFLDENAPDTHAALLRVSLQTGLPLTLLRTPDNLSDAEYNKVAESVRLILGKDVPK